jgi:cytochrome c-type biogenesis protein CcmH/NrfG
MGMEYIKIVPHGNRRSIVIESEMYIFLVLVVIMLIITLASYFAWARYKRVQRKKDLVTLMGRKKHRTW